MTQNNSYLESFKLMVVEKYMSGMTKNEIMRQFGISSSTLYLWKLKYKDLIRDDYIPRTKASLAESEFVDVTAPAAEAAADPKGMRYEGDKMIRMECKGYVLHFDAVNLPKVLEMLGV